MYMVTRGWGVDTQGSVDLYNNTPAALKNLASSGPTLFTIEVVRRRAG